MSLPAQTDAPNRAKRSRGLNPVTRIRSLHYLRGISALLVFYGHTVVIGLLDGATPRRYWPMIPDVPLSPQAFADPHALLRPEELLDDLGVSIGYFGVCLFFLISGYVILGSLQKISASSFVLGRVFRIWPLLAFVSVAFGLVFSGFVQRSGFETPYTADDFTMSLIFCSSGTPSIPVMWSLIVEVWFYVSIGTAFFLLKPATFGFRAILVLFVICIGIVASSAICCRLWPNMPADHFEFYTFLLYFSYNFTFVCLVLIGSGIYQAHSDRRWWSGFAISICGMASFALDKYLFSVSFGEHYLQQFSINNGIAAIIVFVPVLAVDRYIPPIRVLKILGDVSYPLYLCHITLVWILLFSFNQRGYNGLTTLALSTLIILALSYGLHRAIEKPSHELGKWLGRKLERSGTMTETSRPR